MEAARAFVLAGLMVALAASPLVGAATLPAQLTLEGPLVARVGDAASYEGSHHLRVALQPPLPPAKVVLLVDGALAGTGTTTLGRYEIAHAFPARGTYVVQAVADPGGPAETASRTLTVVAGVAPGPAQNVAATALAGAPSVRVSWDPPLDDGGVPVGTYFVQRHEGSGGFLTRATLGGDARSYTDTGLVLGRTYTYRVLAANALGLAPPADASVKGDEPLAPAVSATPIHLSTNALVSVASGGGATQALDVERSLDGGATWTRVQRWNDAAPRTFSDGLASGAHPLYRGVARSLVGEAVGAPVAPTGELPGAPAAFASWIDTQLQLNWSHPAEGGPVQGYRLLIDGAPAAHMPWPAQSRNLTPLVGTHTYAVLATSMLGDGPATEPITITLDAASAPTVTATFFEELEAGRAEVAWTEPLSDGGSRIQRYEVWRSTDGAPPVRIASPSASTFSLADPRLPDGHTYTYYVHAVTAVGAGFGGAASGAIAPYDWQLAHDIVHFTACETTSGVETCATVAPEATYDRQGNGMVRYAATFGGTLTRRGVPVEGIEFISDVWETNDTDGENAEGFLVTTDAAGQYQVSWSRPTAILPSCDWVSFDSRAWYGSEVGHVQGRRFRICP